MHDINGFMIGVGLFLWRKEIYGLFKSTIIDIINS